MDLTSSERRLIQTANASTAQGDRRFRIRATIGLVVTLLAAPLFIISLFLGHPDPEGGIGLCVFAAMAIGANLVMYDSARSRARTNALIRKLSRQVDLADDVHTE